MSRTSSNARPSAIEALAYTMETSPENGHVVALVQNRDEVIEGHQTVRAALAGMTLDEGEVDLACRHYVSIVKAYASTVQQTIEIGTHLLDLRKRISHGAFSRFIKSGILPFQENFAFKVMAVSESIERFRVVSKSPLIDMAQLPALTVCYELTTLDDDQLQTAISRGLMKPSATIKEIGAFKTELKATRTRDRLDAIRSLAKARKELARLQGQVFGAKEKVDRLERIVGPEFHSAD